MEQAVSVAGRYVVRSKIELAPPAPKPFKLNVGNKAQGVKFRTIEITKL
jgi:hypothetical protein